jgi:uncharacterized protein
MSIELIDLATPVAAEPSAPSPDRLLGPVPTQTVANYFSDATQQFFAGRWTSTPGKWRIRYTESELCVILAGRVVLTNDAGSRSEFGAGAAFVVPAGFSGTWEVLEDCTKLYAIFEPRP